MKLRQLETQVLRELKGPERQLELSYVRRVFPAAFHGIEIDSFPAAIARTAMWMADHLCNLELGEELGIHVPTIPLREGAAIIQGNALRMDWDTAFSDMEGKSFSYILGNPPYSGARMMRKEQKADMHHAFGKDFRGVGDLDYVSSWFYLASKYMVAHTSTKTAFVATNSIVQGQQPALLWNQIASLGQSIQFAYRTFNWTSAARGAAAVHCVIVGFSSEDGGQRLLWEEPELARTTRESDDDSLPVVWDDPLEVSTINGYLMADAGVVCVEEQTSPLCKIPDIRLGNMPIDGGYYLFKTQERDNFVKQEPGAKLYFRRWVGAQEYLHGWERWCLRVAEIPASELAKLPMTKELISKVKQYRLTSKRPATRLLAETPMEFHVTNIPDETYIVVPEVTSGQREYIPMGLEQPSTLCSNKLRIIRSSDLYIFGVLQSSVSMAWMRAVGGRLKSDYSYSAGMVYNTFPWPESPSKAQKDNIRLLSQKVLDARAAHPDACLADLYDPTLMPADLRKAHTNLDKAVIKLYGEKWKDDKEIVLGLSQRYAKLVAQKQAKE